MIHWNSSSRLWSASRTALVAAALGCGSLVVPQAMMTAAAQENGAAQTSRTDAQIQADVLQQIATARGIKGQKITANTQNGVVTLTGSVSDEVTRQIAENAVSSVNGVTSVRNNLVVGDLPAPDAGQAAAAGQPAGQPANGEASSAAQSSGWGPAGPPPDAVNGQVPPQPAPATAPNANQSAPATQAGPAPQAGTSYGAPLGAAPEGNYPPQGYPQQGGYPPQQGSYPQQQGSYPQQSGYPNAGAPNYPAPANGYPARPAYQQPQPYVVPKGPVTIPAGALLTVRLQNFIDARRIQPGDSFVVNAARDVFQDGVLAIPLGATLEGLVVAVKKPGAFSGGGDIQVELSQLDLDGHSYPIATDMFSTETPGKGGRSAANTIGGTAFGAILGAAVGGGPGAAIGAVAGGATGAAISTAEPGPRSFIPAETLITFHLKSPVTLQPVSPQEATRLAASMPRPVLRPRVVYGPPPGYYPGPYYR